MEQQHTSVREKKIGRLPRFLKILGPGLITGAADDDPSGIATYSQAGAQFGYGQLWTVVFLYPLMTAVQEACARIGAVTKKGIAAVVKEHYGKSVLYSVVFLIVVANTINIGADIGAMAEAARLAVPVPFAAAVLFFVALILALEVFIPYRQYARVLKWLAATMLVYPAILFFVREPWSEILRSTFLPHIEFGFGFFFIFTAVVGTTISPYMFFWQASEEVEEEIGQGLDKDAVPNPGFIRRLRIDTAIGMFLSQLIAWCIIVAAGTVLHPNGVVNIASAADAAKALLPLVQTFPHAGFAAELIFAAGIVGLGLLSVPILAGSAAYAVAEAFSWREGLFYKLREAHGFYGIITIATLAGLAINFIGIHPIRALIVASAINGAVSIPLIYCIIRISSNRGIMAQYASGKLSQTFLWIALFAISASAALTLWAFW